LRTICLVRRRPEVLDEGMVVGDDAFARGYVDGPVVPVPEALVPALPPEPGVERGELAVEAVGARPRVGVTARMPRR
jgi:hypothetical protein